VKITIDKLHRQTVLGLAFGLIFGIGWLVWANWSRAEVFAIVLAGIPPALVLLRRPVVGLALLAFSLTSYLSAFVPHVFILSLMLTLAATVYNKAQNGDYNWTFPPFVGWSLLLYCWIPFTILWTKNYDYLRPVLVIQIIPFMLLMPELIRTPQHVRQVLLALGAGMIFTAVSSVYGVYTLFASGMAIQVAGSVQALQVARYTGHWTQANDIGHTLMPFMLLFLPFIRRSENFWMRAMFAASFFSGLVAIILSLSRAALLSLALGLAIVIYNSRYRWIATTVVASIVLLSAMVLPIDLFGRLSTLAHGGRDASFHERSYVMQAGMSMVEDSFPLGHGMGSFWELQQDYYFVPFKVAHAHNSYIQLLAEYGIVGALFFMFAVASLSGVFRNWVAEEPRYGLSRQLRIALIGTFFALLLAMTFETMLAWPSYWLAFILISVCPSIFGKSETIIQ
jgi:O-antigen ligase